MCRCVECLFFNQFWIFFLYIPYIILFIENGDIFLWLLPISWYKCLRLKSDFSSSCDSSSHWTLTCSRHDIPENCSVGVKQQVLTYSLTLLAIPCEISWMHFQTLNVSEIKRVLKFLDFHTKIQYFIFRQYLCIVVLNWVTFILYSSFIIPWEGCFSWHTSWKRCCVCLHMTSRFYAIDIGCIVVNEIDVILELLTWARKYNILFHENKTILLLFKSFSWKYLLSYIFWL
jgi:hypothetical protein